MRSLVYFKKLERFFITKPTFIRFVNDLEDQGNPGERKDGDTDANIDTSAYELSTGTYKGVLFPSTSSFVYKLVTDIPWTLTEGHSFKLRGPIFLGLIKSMNYSLFGYGVYHVEQNQTNFFMLATVKLVSYLITSRVSKALGFVDIEILLNMVSLWALSGAYFFFWYSHCFIFYFNFIVGGLTVALYLNILYNCLA